MTGTRRILVLIGLTLAVTIGAAIPASATFADSVSAPATTLATGTVAAPASVTVDDHCVTTTTTVKRTMRTDPVTGVSTQTYYNSTTSTAVSSTNVQGTTTTTTAGPGVNETTTTTVTKNTDLVVTASWTPSASRGVSGYLVTAHLGINNSSVQMDQTTATSTSARVDADYLYYQPSLSVTTLTTYKWTAQSARTAVLSC